MYLTLTKKRLGLIILGVCLAFFVLIQFFSVKAEEVTLSTNAERIEFIESLSVTLQNDEFSQKEVVIPEEFGDVYNSYNNLQIQSGFNLSGYRGKKVSVYTYRTNDGKCVNLIICKNKLIGGDISDISVEGDMLPLKGN